MIRPSARLANEPGRLRDGARPGHRQATVLAGSVSIDSDTPEPVSGAVDSADKDLAAEFRPSGQCPRLLDEDETLAQTLQIGEENIQRRRFDPSHQFPVCRRSAQDHAREISRKQSRRLPLRAFQSLGDRQVPPDAEPPDVREVFGFA